MSWFEVLSLVVASSALAVSVRAIAVSKALRDRDAALQVSIHTLETRLSEDQSRREIEVSERQHLEDLWQGVLTLASENPRFLDVNVTENYLSAMDGHERFTYDIYCHKAWGHVQDVVDRGFSERPKFQVAIQWLVTFHHKWLEDNPGMFVGEAFWTAVNRGKSMPAVILRHPRLPKNETGGIDWNAASEDYHSRILSPLNPVMLDETEPGGIRNRLVHDLRLHIGGSPDKPVEIADFGCGNGNLLEAIKGYPVKVIGIDQAADALRIAERRAGDMGVLFTSFEGDMCKLNLQRTFETIVSVNSILPSSREEVRLMLRAIRMHLDPERGMLFAILPSFDTTSYLRQLWYDQFLASSKSHEHAQRVVDALKARKMVDDVNLRYADDGESQQCYHTRKTIKKEFERAGLALVGKPQKIYYPWDLTRRFDYGYFPNASEEIWDWYVVARPAEAVGVPTLSAPGFFKKAHDYHKHSGEPTTPAQARPTQRVPKARSGGGKRKD